jgi:hypothetical protein
MGKVAVRNPEALQQKIESYRAEWNSYDARIRTALANRTDRARSAA